MNGPRLLRAVVVFTGAILAMWAAVPVRAQGNPCAEEGADCRPLTASEASSIRARLLALQAALPVPDPARFSASTDVDKAFTLPFVAEMEAGAPLLSRSWPGGAFTERGDVQLLYEGKGKAGAGSGKAKNPWEAAQDMQAALADRVEVIATLLPHPFLVGEDGGRCVDVTESDATDVEKTATFLSYIHSDGTALRMVFGRRTCREEETLRVERPAASLAPVTSIALDITAPSRTEILALKKKIDRKAFETLLGPVG